MSRAVRIEGDVAYVPLTRGYTAIIDASDVHLVDGRLWSALVSKRRKAVYAVRVEQRNGRQKMILMHRLISDAPDGVLADHRDGDGLNNRRANIRHCSQAENNLNTGLRRDNQAGFKGVALDKRNRRWKAEIRFGGHRKFLGYFDTAESAHAAYCEAAVALHGDFARTA